MTTPDDDIRLQFTLLTKNLLDATTHEEALLRVAEVAQASLEGVDACGVTVRDDADLTTVAGTSTVSRIDAEQYAVGEGPCLSALLTGKPHRMDLDAEDQEWPEFAAAARPLGVTAVLALPLIADTRTIGALNLYSLSPGGIPPSSEPLAMLYAEHAAAALTRLHAQMVTAELATKLEDHLVERDAIERATGVLMGRSHMSYGQALARLTQHAKEGDRALLHVAHDVLRNYEEPR